MGAFGQYGASPVVAQFQGFINANAALVTRAAQNCSVAYASPGVLIISLNTPSVLPVGEVSVDDATYLAQVTQYGQPAQQVDIDYGTPEPNDITFTFITSSTPTDPAVDALFNVVIFNCVGGIDANGDPLQPGNP
jgi:hypothetical protein